MKSTARGVRDLVILALLAAVLPLGGADPPAEAKASKKAAPKPESAAVEVRFTDGSVLKLTLREERLELKTAYGKLLVPFEDIRRIDFATRIPDEAARRIRSAITDLGSPEFRLREDASADLLALREKAYPALLEAAEHKDPEVARRARGILERVREAVPEEQLEVRKHDVIHTEDSRIAGRIEAATWKAFTTQFGEVRLNLADALHLHAPGAEGEFEAGQPLADPGNLMALAPQVGKRFAFKVKGAVNGGALYGTDVYTADSFLAMAAVHAGVLRPGQTGVVRVKIVAPPVAFPGSTRNGVTSTAYTNQHPAYQILR